MKFERDEGSFRISFCVHYGRIFAKPFSNLYYKPLAIAWFMMLKISALPYRYI